MLYKCAFSYQFSEQHDDTGVELVLQSDSEESSEYPDSRRESRLLRWAHDATLEEATPWKSTELTKRQSNVKPPHIKTKWEHFVGSIKSRTISEDNSDEKL